VAWETICLPKKEGGLGIKRLATWNQVSMLNHYGIFFSVRFSVGCLDPRKLVEREEFLAGLHLELEKKSYN